MAFFKIRKNISQKSISPPMESEPNEIPSKRSDTQPSQPPSTNKTGKEDLFGGELVGDDNYLPLNSLDPLDFFDPFR